MRAGLLTIILLFATLASEARTFTVGGVITDEERKRPVEYASVLFRENGLWAVSDSEGRFVVRNVPQGKYTVIIQCLGYARRTMSLNVNKDITTLSIAIKEENLKLDEVEVVAKRKSDEATTSYTIDRMALDNQQILNLSEISTLLPGGKTVNGTLMSDSRIALRSGESEMGNASFGTAIEIDGMRIDNNAAAGETMAAATRNISSANIESVEIVTGIPSVEYGDLSNGVVKVNTRRGKSPFIVEGKLNQHTRQLALHKGFEIGRRGGVINMSFERARSFSDIASPYTAYQRNVLSMNYMNVFMKSSTPLTLNIGASGNIGGFDSKADPDRNLDDYSKARDNNFRLNADMRWLLNKSWITNLSMKALLSVSDKKSESYNNANSSSTQAYIHSLEEGYFIAQDYDSNPDAAIILGPTGYWYVKSFSDSKPVSYSLSAKGEWTKRFGKNINKLMLGSDFAGSRNNGRGRYYDDMRYAPSWREYKYSDEPAMNNLALFLEDKLTLPLDIHRKWRNSSLEITAGLREDITIIGESEYGTVNSLSPRVNSRFVLWRGRDAWIRRAIVHAGWGKSVKLPSFQVLYPRPSYSDRLAFASTSAADNTSYYAYYTYPSKARYNADLKWQYTNQTDIGLEMDIKGTRVTISGYHHRTYNPYMATAIYSPFTYKYTGISALQQCGIDVANRRFSVDRNTGVVTVSDASGVKDDVALQYTERKTYTTNTTYTNASPIDRYGLEWIVDFAQIRPLRTSLRIDGSYYYYKGFDETLFADVPLGVTSTQSDGQLFSYIGYYRGCNATSAGYTANASLANGSLSKSMNMNATVTTHVPKIRMIVALRLEWSAYQYRRALSEYSDAARGYMIDDNSAYFGEPYDGTSENKYVVVYPEYYSTWDDPSTLIPFYDKFVWARDNDRQLYSDLARLVVKSNYPYTMNPNRISGYCSANISITKEIGDHVSVSFYANNFFNNMKKVHSSQTDLETSLFASGYIPSYYYGLSLRLKL